MHPYIFESFNRLLAEKNLTGPALEIGALPNETTLLNLPVLQTINEKVGVNLDGPYVFKDFVFHRWNANKMDLFADNYFSVILCNAMLEHDKFFWKTLREINRIAKPGGLVVIGTPGYSKNPLEKFKQRFCGQSWYKKVKSNKRLNFILSSTLTLEVHGAAFGDFYRFSSDAYKYVFFEGYNEVEIIEVMQPPRIIGLGHKPIT